MSETSTPVETPEQTIDRLRTALAAAQHEEEMARSENGILQQKIEAMEAKNTPLTVFVEAVQEAHVSARHVGHWEACPHPVCRSLEAKVLDWRKGGMT